MPDDALRALRRSLDASSDPRARIRYARELERRGDAPAALVALLEGSADPAVREEIARYPSWTHEDGGPGHGRWLDARPITESPRVRWIHEHQPGALRASPLGLVCHGPTLLQFLDLDSGERRASTRRASAWDMPGSIAGQVYLTMQPAEDAHDLVTGERLWRRKPDEHAALSTRELLVRLTVKENVLVAFAREDSRKPPRERLWRWPKKGSLPDGIDGTVLVAGGGVVVLAGAPRFAVVDAKTGEERFQGDGWTVLVDEEGLFLHDDRDSSIASLALDGTERWRKKSFTQLDALAPSFVVARQKKHQLVVLDRKTGKLGAKLPPRHSVLGVARDVVYVHEPARTFVGGAARITALDASGHQLWRIALDEYPDLLLESAALGAGRLYVSLARRDERTAGFVLCLEQPG